MTVSRYAPWILILCVTSTAAAQDDLRQAAVEVGESPEVRVILDGSGVESRFVNPVNPIELKGRPLVFENNTGDRTFVVTIPFAYSPIELASAYATADKLRRGRTVSDVVCDALQKNVTLASGARLKGEPCDGDGSERNEIDTLQGLRVLLETVSAAKPTDLAACGPQPKSGDCVAEALFWTSYCQLELDLKEEQKEGEKKIKEGAVDLPEIPTPEEVLLSFAQEDGPSDRIEKSLHTEAPKLLARLLEKFPEAPVCDLATASGHQARIVGKLTIPAEYPPLVDPIAAEAGSAGLKARFGAARVELARNELTKAIRERMGFPEQPNEPRLDDDGNVLLDTEGKPEEVFQEEIQSVFGKLEVKRRDLMDQDTTKAEVQCRLREVEAAGRLLASYSPDASVPYSGVPRTLLDPKATPCSGMVPKSTRGETKEEKEAMAAEERKMTMAILTTRRSEQGIEVHCTAPDACSATATIPPYQQATFSRSVLNHHPKPRIAFTVSFFGDPESPANPVGYVTRIEAKRTDEKPESKFNLQLGGDSSFSLDPELTEVADKPVAGQLRHFGGSGTLSFQYSGPVEASATVQYKKGDFGGTDSKQLETSQYQVKVYGPARVVLQAGRIPFVNPSSSIAINVVGEGLQLIKDRWSAGYVVLRESEEGTANRRNQDNEVAFVQLKNEPAEWPPLIKKKDKNPLPFLRNYDLVGIYGRDRRDRAADGSKPRPYWYHSEGGEVRWGGFERVPSLGGSFAVYRSFRHVSEDRSIPPGDGREDEDSAPPQTLLDGKGTVGLARVSWTHLTVPNLKEPQATLQKSWGLSGFFGYGTGDKPKTTTVDEGYLGENASYTNDMIFLSRLAAPEALGSKIGRGLANKRYYGAQYTDARWSALAWVNKLLKAEKDVASFSTVITAHYYEFNQPVQGRRAGGKEADLVFNLESPKNIQWSLGGAYYKSSEALKQLKVEDGVWLATVKLSIKLNSL